MTIYKPARGVGPKFKPQSVSDLGRLRSRIRDAFGLPLEPSGGPRLTADA